MAGYHYEGPREFTPMSPWAYVGYRILFAIPVVGFVLLIVFSFIDGNIARRNFARSYWCELLLGLGILTIVILVLVLIFGVALGDLGELEYYLREILD